MPITCDVDFIVVGVLGERGPCDEEGEVGTQLISSSTICGCGPTVAVSDCACEEGKREGGREGGDRWLDLGMPCCREVCTCVFTINVYKDQLLYVLAFYMYMIPPHIILAHVLSHVPVFISPALVPKRLVHYTLIRPLSSHSSPLPLPPPPHFQYACHCPI